MDKMNNFEAMKLFDSIEDRKGFNANEKYASFGSKKSAEGFKDMNQSWTVVYGVEHWSIVRNNG